ncbi:MAG: hypothetical protein J6Y90_05170 [Lachnospiraceae bacterium]|nr:hypothetical protein [Lachnospiraceae bacterium]
MRSFVRYTALDRCNPSIGVTTEVFSTETEPNTESGGSGYDQGESDGSGGNPAEKYR